MIRLEHNFFRFPQDLDDLLLRIVQAIWIIVVVCWVCGIGVGP